MRGRKEHTRCERCFKHVIREWDTDDAYREYDKRKNKDESLKTHWCDPRTEMIGLPGDF